MAAPTIYTEELLAAYMHRILKTIAAQMGWSVVASSYDDAVDETLLIYGVSNIAAASDIRKLRLIAVQEVWRAVQTETSGDFNFEADGARFDRKSVFEQATKMFKQAEADVKNYVPVTDEPAADASSVGSVAVPNEAVW